jgi:hypothetical protein
LLTRANQFTAYLQTTVFRPWLSTICLVIRGFALTKQVQSWLFDS